MSLAFYDANYDLIFFRELRPGKREALGSKSPRKCRFCAGEPPETSFKAKTHAVSRLTGNNVLLTYEECSSCNEIFAKVEDDLGKFTLPGRTFDQVSGYQKIPSLKVPTGRMDMRPGNLRIEVDPATMGQTISDDAENHRLTISVPMQPYRPLGVYKALVKMALTVMPSGELGAFQQSLRWLATDGVEENAATDGIGALCIQTFCAKVYRFPIVRLLRGKPMSSTASYATFVLCFGSNTYQIFIRADGDDESREGNLVLQAFPPAQLVSDRSAEDWVDVGVVSLASPEKVTGSVWKRSFTYQKRVEPETSPDSTS